MPRSSQRTSTTAWLTRLERTPQSIILGRALQSIDQPGLFIEEIPILCTIIRDGLSLPLPLPLLHVERVCDVPILARQILPSLSIHRFRCISHLTLGHTVSRTACTPFEACAVIIFISTFLQYHFDSLAHSPISSTTTNQRQKDRQLLRCERQSTYYITSHRMQGTLSQGEGKLVLPCCACVVYMAYVLRVLHGGCLFVALRYPSLAAAACEPETADRADSPLTGKREVAATKIRRVVVEPRSSLYISLIVKIVLSRIVL